jgi:hypothetical protein
MKFASLKYFIAVILLSIFMLRGLASLSTLQSLLVYTSIEQELPIDAEEERSEGKSSTKIISEKEFVDEYDNLLTAPSYTIIASGLPAYYHIPLQDVFPAIITPPPRC